MAGFSGGGWAAPEGELGKDYIRIVNWASYQHYKDRNPPWIKLHRELITSRLWVYCDDKTRVLAIAIMLLAADTDNKIPLDDDYIRRRSYLNSKPNLQPLIEKGFIEVVCNQQPLADCSKVHANARPETETEAETEADKNIYAPKTRRREDVETLTKLVKPYLEEIYQAYPRKAAKGAALKAIAKAMNRLIKSQDGPKDLFASMGDVSAYLLQRVKTYAHSPDGKAGEYTPYPATWFNQKHYLDDDTEWWKRGENRQDSTQSARLRRNAESIAKSFGLDGSADASVCDPENGEGVDGGGERLLEGSLVRIPPG